MANFSQGPQVSPDSFFSPPSCIRDCHTEIHYTGPGITGSSPSLLPLVQPVAWSAVTPSPPLSFHFGGSFFLSTLFFSFSLDA